VAFLKYARAQVVQSNVTKPQWSKIRTASASGVSTNLVTQASEIFKKDFNPKDYLLTHCTIVASVDTMKVPNVKLGAVFEGGKKLNRKYSDYRITPETDIYINNNLDSFPREVLKKSFKTFVGAHNFCEHVQIEEQSKGRIIDAVLRDIGPSLYVDILVATDRKHKDLIKDIESGKMGTLSMGSSIAESICTFCGNVAADEPQLCEHIKYQKGNTFYDAQGRKNRIAEICGHSTLENGGVNFIEASWVAVPAFKGAVMRNILSPSEVDSSTIEKAATILNSLPISWQNDKNLIRKAASALYRIAADGDEAPAADEGGGDDAPAADDGGGGGDDIGGGDDAGGGEPDLADSFGDAESAGGDDAGGEDSEKKDDTAPNDLNDLEDQILKKVLKRVKDRVNQTLDKQENDEKAPPNTTESTINLNDNIVKQAKLRQSYLSGLKLIKDTSATSKDFMLRFAKYNSLYGVHIPGAFYKAAWALGNPQKYRNPYEFVKKANKLLNRKLTLRETKLLIRLSQVL
jgi:hypothetical protein